MKKREKLDIVQAFYPGAKSTLDSLIISIDFIEDELDVEATHIMFADSICSDDVNAIQYPLRAKDFLGPFKMGGLNGFPFTGLTGMGAFASHVPDDGVVFIYYGPHIGVSKNGKIGQIQRFGQKESTTCCGAALAGLSKLKKGIIEDGTISEIDYQMNYLEQIILKNETRILKAKNQIIETTEVIYEAIDARINELVDKTAFKCEHVILLGGILINGDTDMGSFFQTKRFDVIDVKSKIRKSYLDNMQA